MTIIPDRRRYYRNTLRQRVMATHRQLDRLFQAMHDHLVIRIRCNEPVSACSKELFEDEVLLQLNLFPKNN